MNGPRNQILVGDAASELRRLPEAFVDCVITSPPYFQLRDYQTAGQIGLEPTVDDWVAELRCVFREVARVLKSSGALWLNVADSYSRHPRYGAPAKAALLAPERLLLALAADGWLVRNKVVWAKPNPMPASVGDRLNTSYEFVYLLVRNRHYFFDLDAIREPHRSRAVRAGRPSAAGVPPWAGPLAGSQDGLRRARPNGLPGHVLGKNPGDVWLMPTRGFRGQHFATFPEQLVERPLLATCPEAICGACGEPWRRRMSVHRIGASGPAGRDEFRRRYPKRWETVRSPDGLQTCDCNAPTVPGLVLDPFFGSGTVAVVAARHRRDWLGIELNPAYARLAEERMASVRTSGTATNQLARAA